MTDRPRFRRPNHATVVAYLALFVALSGTAWAAATIGPGDIKDNAVRSKHIKEGQVKSADVADDSVAAADLAPDSAGFSELDPAAFYAPDISGGGGQYQVSPDGIDSGEIADGSVGAAEIADGNVGAAEIGSGAVGAGEIGNKIVDRPDPTPVLISGGTAGNGDANLDSSVTSCNVGEQLIGGYGQWTPDDQVPNNYELWISEVRLNHAVESVVVDGGNDSGVDHSLVAVATCLGP